MALRNRWRRKQLADDIRDEVYPKEHPDDWPHRRRQNRDQPAALAKLARAPFIKVEATKFTEVGYVGRDVEQIVRDLVDAAIIQTREYMREDVKAKAHAAEDRVIEAIAGTDAREGTREMFRKKLKAAELDDTEIELGGGRHLESLMRHVRYPRPARQPDGHDEPGRHLWQSHSAAARPSKRMTVAESYEVLIGEEADKLLDDETVNAAALESVEQNGIVFLDEIDKVCARQDARGGDVSREGRAARSAATDRRHHRVHQTRPGENRPHPLYRFRRVPHRKTLGSAAGTSGPPCRSVSSCAL